MRIAISGSHCMGKSTLIGDFLSEWQSYELPEKSYRHVLNDLNLPHSSESTKETQKAILDFMCKQVKEYDKEKNVIYDRCPLDNLVYSMWLYHHGKSDIDEEFIGECIPKVRTALKEIDIIFYIPITKVVPTPEYVDNGFRDKDPNTRIEIDNLFKLLSVENRENPKSNYFEHDDKPPIIEIFGSRHERIQIMKLYLDGDGDAVAPDENLFGDENITMEDIEALEALTKPEPKKTRR